MCSDCRLAGWPCTSIKISFSVHVIVQTAVRAAAYIHTISHNSMHEALFPLLMYSPASPSTGWLSRTERHQKPAKCTEKCQGNAWSTHGNIARHFSRSESFRLFFFYLNANSEMKQSYFSKHKLIVQFHCSSESSERVHIKHVSSHEPVFIFKKKGLGYFNVLFPSYGLASLSRHIMLL